MNTREKFLETIVNFNKKVSPPKWEFGYWGELIDSWYQEGLNLKDYPKIPKKISTPAASLSNVAVNAIRGQKLPKAIAVTGGSLYWPVMNFPLDNDVKNSFGMDDSQIHLNVNLLFEPMFESKIIEEDERQLVYIDIDGVKRKFIKDPGIFPSATEYIIKDWKSWLKLKEERLRPDDIKKRFAPNWPELLEKYKNRDFPLVLGGAPCGYFGTLALVMGYEVLFANYYDDPKLIHDIQQTFTDLWINIFEEIFSQTSVDMFVYWEDLSAGSGPMISPAIIKEFLSPYYKRMSAFLKSKGVNALFVDTDGYCFDIIHLFVESGVTGLYPIEASCGMDIEKVRNTFPNLQMMGGIPKFEIMHGKERIDKILEPVGRVVKTGGYIPFGDHLISPGVSWENFTYYRQKLNQILDNLEG